MISLEDALDAYVRVSWQTNDERGSENEGAQIQRPQTLELHWCAAKGLLVQSINFDVEAATLTFTNVAKHARKLIDKVLLLYLQSLT